MDSTLEYLEICKNNITILDPGAFQRFPKLIRLVLDDNSRLKFPFNGTQFLSQDSLIDLQCERCGIEKIYSQSLRYMPKLEIINLNANAIAEISPDAFLGNRDLKVIILSQNNLSSLSNELLVELSAVKVLNVSMNPLLEPEKKKPFLKSSVLEELWCDECGFSIIYYDTFAKLPNLTRLNLRRNEIVKITTPALLSHENLSILMLQNNQLSSINVILLNKLNKLCLDGNTIKLNCSLIASVEIETFYCSSSSGVGPECIVETTTVGSELGTLSSTAATVTTEITETTVISKMPVTIQALSQTSTVPSISLPVLVRKEFNAETITGISDAYISGYLLVICLVQIGVAFVLFVYLKLKKYDSNPEVNIYSENIINPNAIHTAIY
ncbi:insulin-like growth factor-binding protein complex acid labile subunit isoform X2 [Malaya genurostris]|nr:insulin-like growth factor-binding protein complex acid labile subunit isoform X2 [Malaya genurostris]